MSYIHATRHSKSTHEDYIQETELLGQWTWLAISLNLLKSLLDKAPLGMDLDPVLDLGLDLVLDPGLDPVLIAPPMSLVAIVSPVI